MNRLWHCTRIASGSLLVCVLALISLPVLSQAQNALSAIRARGEIVIATDPTYTPFEFIENDQIKGFDVDLGEEIARELGVKVRWLRMEWAGIVASLETRKCDAVMAGVTITEERKKNLGFSRPYFLSGQCIVRRKGDTRIMGPQDLLDKTVAVIHETTGQKAVEKLGVPKDRIHRFDTQADGLQDVANSRSDTAVGDLPAMKDMLRKSFPTLEVVGGIFTKENVGIETRKADLDLIGAINAALDRIMVDGRYARIYEEWIGEPLTTDAIAEMNRFKDAGTPVPASLVTTVKVAPPPGASASASPAGSVTIRLDLLAQSMPLLLQGAKLTLWVTFLTVLFGVPGGLLVALMRISHLPPIRWLAAIYIEVIRGTPLLMQIYVIYFVLPSLGVNLGSPLTSAVLALSLSAAAYNAEIFRAGIESIEVGQTEAARSLGMRYVDAMRWVVLPQALRRVLPPLTNEIVALLKDTSLVSVVALTELMRIGKELATNQGSPTTIYLGVALIYLVMTLPLTWLVRKLEAAWQPVSKLKKALPRRVQAAHVVK